MKNKLEGKKETQTLAARTLDNVGQTKKPMELQGPAIDETVRKYQTECGGWQQGANARHAPTSHTSNEVTMTVLDPMPSTGKEPNQSNTMSGGAVKVLGSATFVPVLKKTWDYQQPERTIHE